MASIKITVTDEEFMTLLAALNCTKRHSESDAEIWDKLAAEGDRFPNAPRNAEVHREEATKAAELYNELIRIRARQA